MKPVVTPVEMRAIDAQSSVGEAELIKRAGWAVAYEAKQMLGGTYGRRICVIAGKGNNGADGRVAAGLLGAKGAAVRVIEPSELSEIRGADLIIDAAYGTGFRGEYRAPSSGPTPVLAVDIPSGVDGLTGLAAPDAVRADQTVTFAALKPGLLFADGPMLSGNVKLVDIGLDIPPGVTCLIEDSDVRAGLVARERDSHKWQSAVVVVAGSPGMMGAAGFVVRATLRSGAGMVRLVSPGTGAENLPVGEAVAVPTPATDWSKVVIQEAGRAKALVIGPGLGRGSVMASELGEVLKHVSVPILVDGDGLGALSQPEVMNLLKARNAATVLTPHDGEFDRLTGQKPGKDRINSARALARSSGATVLLKGSTTVVASPDGQVLLAAAGGSCLATAGTGDVLSGLIGAFLARGLDPLMAAAAGAHVHGRAGSLGFNQGLLAGDLPELIAEWLSNE